MQIKINGFIVDQNLMYLIQSITKNPTADILCYFHNLVIKITEEYLDKNKGTKKLYKKTLRWHYPDTDIPYKMELRGDMIAGSCRLYISVAFPTKKDHIDVTSVMNTVVENILGLEGSEALPLFNKPQTRVPAGFRKSLHK